MDQDAQAGRSIELPGFVFDPAQAELWDKAGARVSLRLQVREVLRCLACKPDQVVTKDELMRAVWPGVVVTDDSLVQCIADLRRALRDDDRRIVQTEARRGYRLVTSGTQGASEGAAALPAPKGIPSEFRQETRFATTKDGVRIAYAISGKGPPLVRSAHWMTNLESEWRSPIPGPWIQRLSRRFMFVRYDQRGCGLSDRDAEAGTLDQCVADLEAAVDAAGLDRFALLGLSGGSTPAIRYAARHPDKVSRLVLTGGMVRGRLRRATSPGTLAGVEAFARVLEEGWGRENPAFRQVLTSLLYPAADAEQFHSFNELQRNACSPRTAAQLLRRISEFDALDDLPRIRCPTLVMHSPYDANPIEEARLCAAMIPGASFEAFDSPNHLPLPNEPAYETMWSHIEEFFLEADDAVAELGKRRPSRPNLHDVNQDRRDAAQSTARRRGR